MKRSKFLTTPIVPFEIEPGLTAERLLERMEKISFQGRNLAVAHRVWQKMLGDDCLIFMGLAGAMSAGGMRQIVSYLITRRYIDCLVSTGANLYHDLHETLGRHHFLGSPLADDVALQKEHIDRVYDTYVSEDEFIENDNFIAEFASTLEARPYTTREFLYRLGEGVWQRTSADGILTAAFRARVPIFCPAISDSSIGMGLAQARHRDPCRGHIDVIGDVVESSNLVIRRRRTATVVIGGGTPKNFINQASVEAEFFSAGIGGHRYALQIITDAPHFGGASGSTFEEARSWGKLAAEADQVTVHVDATIGLPVLVSALASTGAQAAAGRRRPEFVLDGPALGVDGFSFTPHRFDAAP